MHRDQARWEDRFLTRRTLLCRGGMGMGALALSGIMGDAFGDATHPANATRRPAISNRR